MQAIQDLGKCYAVVPLISLLVRDKASDVFVYLHQYIVLSTMLSFNRRQTI
jgi:hypothetical protein